MTLLSAETSAELRAIADEIESAAEADRERLAAERFPDVAAVLERLNDRAAVTRDQYDTGLLTSARGALRPVADGLRESCPVARRFAEAVRHVAYLFARHPVLGVSAPAVEPGAPIL